MTRLPALLALSVWLGSTVGAAQGPPRLDKTAQEKVDETIGAYAAAWNEPDVAARRQLLEKAWAAIQAARTIAARFL